MKTRIDGEWVTQIISKRGGFYYLKTLSRILGTRTRMIRRLPVDAAPATGDTIDLAEAIASRGEVRARGMVVR